MLLRLAYLSVTNAFALLRLLPQERPGQGRGDLVLRHQITVLERQLGKTRPQFSPQIGRSSRHCYTDSHRRHFADSAC